MIGGSWIDLTDQDTIVSDESELDEHLTLLLQQKARDVIIDHASSFPDQRLFLYYAMQNLHEGDQDGFEAPSEYIHLCTSVEGYENVEGVDDWFRPYCALMIMVDEAVSDTVCALEEAGMADNTLLVLAGDNGGWKQFPGSNFPFRGAKGSLLEGGIHVPAFMYGPPSLIPEELRGTTYGGLLHVTDWLPTFMGLASRGSWTGPSNGYAIDGIDMYDAIMDSNESARSEICHNANIFGGNSAMQIGPFKLLEGAAGGRTIPQILFEQNGTIPSVTCNLEKVDNGNLEEEDDGSLFRMNTNLRRGRDEVLT